MKAWSIMWTISLIAAFFDGKPIGVLLSISMIAIPYIVAYRREASGQPIQKENQLSPVEVASVYLGVFIVLIMILFAH